MMPATMQAGTDGDAGDDAGTDGDAGDDAGTDGDAGDDAGTDGDAGDDADGDTDTADTGETVETVAVALDTAQTVPPAVGADGASGTGDIIVDTETGAISGSVAVSGTTGVPTVASVQQGAPGETGAVLIPLEISEDGTIVSIPEGAVLDEAGIQAFEDGNLFINVATEANPDGELRAQLAADGGDIATGDGTDLPVDGDSDGSGDTSELAENIETVSLGLDSAQTEPQAVGADSASGTGDITVDTETGAIFGSVTVSGTTGVPTMAHIHEGAPGVAGPILITMVSNEDGTVWTIPEGAALDAAGIQAFEDGNLYVNVHTEANPTGELRGQLVDNSESLPPSGSVTVSFVNLSDSQPMTPPVVILHNAPESENGIRYFQIGDVVGEEVEIVAEDGDIAPLIENAQGQILAGRVSAVGAAVPEEGGPLLPGATASVTLTQELPDQVLSIVVMVVCTNDGFTGVDSLEIAEGTFTTPVYDAGSETNVEMLDWWVPPCGTETNETDDENGVITLHPGQANAENPDFNFPEGSELLEVTISVNE